MKTKHLCVIVCAGIIGAGIAGYAVWYATDREETPRDIILRSFEEGIERIDDTYRYEEGEVTVDLNIPAESLGDELPDMLQFLGTLVEGAETAAPETVTASLGIRYRGRTESPSAPVSTHISLSSNLLEDQFLLEALMSDDTLFFRILETPTFTAEQARKLLDGRRGVWMREDIDGPSAEFLDGEKQLKQIMKLYTDLGAMLVRENVLRPGIRTDGTDGVSVSPDGPNHEIEYDIVMERLPDVLMSRAFETEVLEPFADSLHDFDTAGTAARSREETLADFRKIRDDIAVYLREHHDTVTFSGSATVNGETYIPVRWSADITVRLEEAEPDSGGAAARLPVDGFEGGTVRVRTVSNLKKTGNPIEEPTDYETDFQEFFEQLLFSLTFALLPVLNPGLPGQPAF